MAPEIIQMSGFTTASDVWSVGCTVIELISGAPPFFELAPMSALFRIVHENCPPLPPAISDRCTDFLMQCFKKDTAVRPTARKLRAHAWLTTPPATDGASADGGSGSASHPTTCAPSDVAEQSVCTRSDSMAPRRLEPRSFATAAALHRQPLGPLHSQPPPRPLHRQPLGPLHLQPPPRPLHRRARVCTGGRPIQCDRAYAQSIATAQIERLACSSVAVRSDIVSTMGHGTMASNVPEQ
eukprot:3935360-Prymnesium_polylepis.2